MRSSLGASQGVVRYGGVLALVLGISFWTGNARGLIPFHMLLGLLVVLALWVLGATGLRYGISAGLAAVTAVWAALLLVVGLVQTNVMPGEGHWVVQLAHFILGLGAIGLGEAIGARIRRSASPRAAA